MSASTVAKLKTAGYGETPTPLEDAVADYVGNHLFGGRNLGA